ncbi:Hypothetical predicted protein [Cloeon dipterum]|uniref:Uncharacterized protein n=1 Tax=Cloeon dipterum TaxID=197152 RepID=A0A8S1CHI9_9INSE|nr:Hypothetical predicted protein [Cloeon dipterum]
MVVDLVSDDKENFKKTNCKTSLEKHHTPSFESDKQLDDQATDQDILKSVEQIYFEENDSDLARHELNKLSATLLCDKILKYRGHGI